MEKAILQTAAEAAPRAIAYRRDFHKHPEMAYQECRTASIVARRCADLGLRVEVGPTVMKAESRLGLPAEEELEAAYRRAEREGADPAFLPATRGGFTGVVAHLETGRPGPVVALRADMDALPIEEAECEEHRPVREGFRSVHPGTMHACGHDGHTAIGLGVVEVLAAHRSQLSGTYRFIFQPGEEGGRGAVPMVDAGVVEGVDYFLGIHLGLGVPSGVIYPAVGDFLASTKMDVLFRGAPAHAAGNPERGRNALLGAAQALQGLYAISRHGEGDSRVNVGVLRGGSGRNVIPDSAYMQLEVRGETDTVEAYMVRRAEAIIQGAAVAHELESTIKVAGRTTTAACDEALAQEVAAAAALVPGLRASAEVLRAGGSEDATFLMRRVQAQGGLATFVGIGSESPDGHHTRRFDLQEGDIANAIAMVALTMARLGAKPHR